MAEDPKRYPAPGRAPLPSRMPYIPPLRLPPPPPEPILPPSRAPLPPVRAPPPPARGPAGPVRLPPIPLAPLPAITTPPAPTAGPQPTPVDMPPLLSLMSDPVAVARNLNEQDYKRVLTKLYDKLDDDKETWYLNSMKDKHQSGAAFANTALHYLSKLPDLQYLQGINLHKMTEEQKRAWFYDMKLSERRKVIEELHALRQQRNLDELNKKFGMLDDKKQKGSGLESNYFGRMTLS